MICPTCETLLARADKVIGVADTRRERWANSFEKIPFVNISRKIMTDGGKNCFSQLATVEHRVFHIAQTMWADGPSSRCARDVP